MMHSFGRSLQRSRDGRRLTQIDVVGQLLQHKRGHIGARDLPGANSRWCTWQASSSRTQRFRTISPPTNLLFPICWVAIDEMLAAQASFSAIAHATLRRA